MEVDPKAIEKNKVYLLYIIHAFDLRMSEEQIITVCNEFDLMSYFDIKICLENLAAAGLLEKSESVNGIFFEINELGTTTLGFFQRELPYSDRVEIDEYAKEHRTEFFNNSRIYATYHMVSEDQFRVIMRLLEKNLPIFEISLFAASKMEAERFINSWRENAIDIYQTTILNILKRKPE